MKFVSTRNGKNIVSFRQALLDCMPVDGGLYVPAESADLRRWILYTGKKTSFASIAGSLTSALIGTEFSPIVCESIATHAFSFEPVMKQLDDRLYTLELFHGPTGSHKDFGISYLASSLETILQIEGGSTLLLDVSHGELGACLSHALKGKSHVKAVILYPAGKIRGLSDTDLVWNGGNIYPIEIDGTEADCHNIVRSIFADHALIEKYHITVANTANIGRLLPQSFFYTYAFSYLKESVRGDIYYALAAGNYSNVVAGLYSWRLSLPVNGFIIPSTAELCLDLRGNCMMPDSVVPLLERQSADPASPSNLERLEEVFRTYALMLRSLVFPANVNTDEISAAGKKLFGQYGVFADENTSAAYAAALKHSKRTAEDEGVVVLIQRDSPALSTEYIQHTLGEKPPVPTGVSVALTPCVLKKNHISSNDVAAVISVLSQVSKN